MRYRLRHDPSQRLEGVAHFGPQGERHDWPAPRTQRLDGSLLEEAAVRLGVRLTGPVQVPR